MILHIISDDKFSEYVIQQFDAIDPTQNEYLFIADSDHSDYKYIQQSNRVLKLAYGSENYYSYCENLSKFNAIVLHSFGSIRIADFISKAPKKTKIAWFFWGYELYNRKNEINKFLGPNTLKTSQKHQLQLTVKSIFNHLLFKNQGQKIKEIPLDVFKQIDYCITHIYEDYLFAKEFLNANFEWAWYNYYSIEKTVGPFHDNEKVGENILIGNSATNTNNHLEVFKKLRKFDLADKKVIVPLSYGNSHFYKKAVLRYGNKYFSKNFYPLMDFLKIEEYNEYIRSCGIVIMNHYRQQAMGNIITALWMGAKVFMSERSTAYKYFKRIGISIFSVESDFNAQNKNALKPLPNEIVFKNRKILQAEYAQESVMKHVNDLYVLLN